MKRLAAIAMVMGLSAAPVMAAAAEAAPAEPVKLADHELDEVVGGAGLLDLNANLNVLLENINVNVNLSNVPVNAGIVVQANLLGQAIQSATVIAAQKVTQAQTFSALP